jgi:glycosyltransferase involved in cell wall biosynthesis
MNSLTFMGHHLPLDGYGYATMEIAHALRVLRVGTPIPIKILDMCPQPGQFAPLDETWNVSGDVVALCTPDWLPGLLGAQRIVAYTMFEASRLPAGWPELINQYAEMCLTPSTWCREMFIENGVRAPIHVARWGVNFMHYPILDRSDHDGPYTFLWSGTPDRRKGWDVAYKAFCAAFGQSSDARLLLHFRYPLKGNPAFGDKNVTAINGLLERPMLRALLRGVDCFVYPSRGEGWGLPPREAAATGLPVIATDAGGLADELPEWGIPLDVRGQSRAGYGFWPENIGEWFEPEIDHLVELMRWCFSYRDRAAAIGERAAYWLAGHATWARTARAVLDCLGPDQAAASTPAAEIIPQRWR